MINLPIEFDDKYYAGMLEILKEINSKYDLSAAKSESEAFKIIDDVEVDEEELKDQAALLVIPLFLEGTEILNAEFQKQFSLEAEKKSFDEWIISNIEMILAIPSLHKKNVKDKLEKIIEEFKKKLDDDLDIQNEIYENITELGEMAIVEGMNTSQNKTKFWAVDQTGSLVSKTTAIIFIANDLEVYIWRDVGDNRVRPLHRSNNGNTFRFDTGDSQGNNPGDADRCRCGAEVE